VADVTADRDGYVGLLDAYRIGRGCVILGAGRATKEDSIDPACGVELVRKLGDRVSAGEPIMRVHYGSETRYIQALDSFRMALEVTDEPPKVGDVIIEEMA
jgi:thymidine phosphorylase